MMDSLDSLATRIGKAYAADVDMSVYAVNEDDARELTANAFSSGYRLGLLHGLPAMPENFDKLKAQKDAIVARNQTRMISEWINGRIPMVLNALRELAEQTGGLDDGLLLSNRLHGLAEELDAVLTSKAGSLDGPRPQDTQPVPLTLWQELRDALGQEDQTLLYRLKQMDIGRDRDVWVNELDAQMRGEK